MKFLLDANLSPETAEFLRRRFSFDVKSLIEERSGGLTDLEVVQLAKNESRIIVTLDLDFGELYHEVTKGAFGVIIIRLRDQRVESVNESLESFFTNPSVEEFIKASYSSMLAVIDETTVRISTL